MRYMDIYLTKQQHNNPSSLDDPSHFKDVNNPYKLCVCEVCGSRILLVFGYFIICVIGEWALNEWVS